MRKSSIQTPLGDGSSPSSIDSNIYQAKLCRTEKPTDDDIAAVVAKAEKMLHDMDLGQWQIDSTSIHTTYYGDTPEYTINVSAVPVFNGTSAARVPQIGNLKSTLAYASNCTPLQTIIMCPVWSCPEPLIIWKVRPVPSMFPVERESGMTGLSPLWR